MNKPRRIVCSRRLIARSLDFFPAVGVAGDKSCHVTEIHWSPEAKLAGLMRGGAMVWCECKDST